MCSANSHAKGRKIEIIKIKKQKNKINKVNGECSKNMRYYIESIVIVSNKTPR